MLRHKGVGHAEVVRCFGSDKIHDHFSCDDLKLVITITMGAKEHDY